jgi:ABC-2 type transport system ATP-binding protein
MKRRLNIAVALVHRPQVLFLDEPTVGIDPQSRNFIFEFVEGLRAEGYTLIYTTHYMEEAERLCDRVAIMDEGHILALDSPQALIERLGGGVIEAGFPAPELDAMAEAIAGLSTVEKLHRRNGRVEIRARDARAALADIVELCRTRDVELLGLEVLKPDLESVFLQLTGRRFRD